MAKTADLGRPDGLDLFRMNDLAPEDSRVGCRGLVPLGLAGEDMVLSRPVARLTGDAQLAGPRFHRASFGVHARFNPRRVTPAADNIPDFRSVRDVRRAHKR